MARLPVHMLKTNARELKLESGQKVYHLPDWHALSHPQRLAVIRQIAMMRGRDPRIARLALKIFRLYKVRPRQYKRQAAAILKWVQNPKNIYYVNEPGERLQDPIYTIKVGHADCFAEDTLVLRDDFELVGIQDVRVGDRIWGKDRWSEVTNFWEKGKLPVTEIGLNNGSVLQLTEGHKLYVKSCEKHGPTCPDLVGKRSNCRHRKFEWIRLKVSEVREGMELLQPEAIKPHGNAQGHSAEMSWLIGAFVAEGWAETSRASISGKDGHWKEATKHRAKAIAEEKGWKTYWHDKYITFNDSQAAALLGECGKGAVNKHIPTGWLANGDLAALDDGLKLDAAQNSRGDGWTFGTVSRTLAVQYRVLQRMQGRSTSWRVVTNHGGYGSKPIHRVGVRVPGPARDKRLRVKTIHREVDEVPCYDIATDDHFVYLPEADCTVSNCDDQAIVLAALFESVGLPWKLVLSGRNKVTGKKLRYIEGEAVPQNTSWAHIYAMVGDRPFRPDKWYFTEPTVEGVPLGWDVISGDESYLPEMAKPRKHKRKGKAEIVKLRKAPSGFRPRRLPRAKHRSPAYEMAYGQVSAAVGSGVAEAVGSEGGLNWGKIQAAVATGVAVSVFTQLMLDWIRGKGTWEGTGGITSRWSKTTGQLATTSVFSSPSPLERK